LQLATIKVATSLIYYISAYNRMETNQTPQDLYLSVQCDILINCWTSVPTTYQCL